MTTTNYLAGDECSTWTNSDIVNYYSSSLASLYSSDAQLKGASPMQRASGRILFNLLNQCLKNVDFDAHGLKKVCRAALNLMVLQSNLRASIIK